MVEIIPYDARLDMELHRVYLNVNVLDTDLSVALAANKEIAEKLEERRLLGAKDRFAELTPEVEIKMVARKNAMLRIIIDRLDVENPLRSAYNHVVYQSPNADAEGNLIENAIILTPPDDIRPVYIFRTDQYIAGIKSDEVIRRLNAAQQELKTCTNTAERHHALAEIAVVAFQPIQQDLLKLKKVGRKIIIQTAVNKSKVHLHDLQAKKNEPKKTMLLPKEPSSAELLANTLLSSKARAPILLKRTNSIVTDLMCCSASVSQLSPTKKNLHLF